MKSDIDLIIEQVKRMNTNVVVSQLSKTHSADDDGVWWFRVHGHEQDVQIESSSGQCPFIIESTIPGTPSRIDRVETVKEVVASVLTCLAKLEELD